MTTHYTPLSYRARYKRCDHAAGLITGYYPVLLAHWHTRRRITFFTAAGHVPLKLDIGSMPLNAEHSQSEWRPP